MAFRDAYWCDQNIRISCTKYHQEMNHPEMFPKLPAGVNFLQKTPRKIAVTSGGVKVE
ncbi:MAG: hypothetical protein MZV64_30325 [Ignavibacteriales bacterium]|nr:hypothetical protein [Ignavibacteriales bacterium]